MKVLVTGHRLYKLHTYDIGWIKESIELAILSFPGMALGLSGVASGGRSLVLPKVLQFLYSVHSMSAF